MPSRPRNITTLEEATALHKWMRPARSGPWRLERMVVGPLDALYGLASAAQEGHERYAPEGEYIGLHKEINELDFRGERRRIPVMSNTPDEIKDHLPFWEAAHGDVLITGLGMGMIVSMLLIKPEVTSITVLEIDPHVINITGKYYKKYDQVNIIEADAGTWIYENLDLTFDCAWHDIWFRIGVENLDEETAEHGGLSYGRMFDLYGEHVRDTQMAWAYEIVLGHKDEAEEQRRRNTLLQQALIDAPDSDTRALLLIQEYLRAVNHMDLSLVDLRDLQTQPLNPLRRILETRGVWQGAHHRAEKFDVKDFDDIVDTLEGSAA